MNREILFRGKCMLDGRPTWTYGDLLHNYGKLYIHPKANMFRVDENPSKLMVTHEVLPETVGQYTGLTDKNGKKIFEGDVVQTTKYGKDNGNGFNYAGKDIFQIGFEDGGYSLRNKWRRFNLRPDTGIEIVGNTTDNPELIGGVGDG